MKIGILTYHRSHNYGALLQAIALKHVLEGLQHQVTYIDYWPSYHRHAYKIFSIHYMIERRGMRKKILYLKNCLKNFRWRRERKKNFNVFIRAFIEPYISTKDETYDLIVHGSDQIWRIQPEIHTYNPVYFGKHNIQAKKKVSYAASMGNLPNTEKNKVLIKNYLNSLDTISVREQELERLVQNLGYECQQHLDPTLLLTAEQWRHILKISDSEQSEKYILYYCLQSKAFDLSEVRRFASSKGLKLITIYSSASGRSSFNNVTTADPQKFIELINGASYVLTSSFHGLAFSLIFHKPFYTAFAWNEGRARSLLTLLGLADRLLVPGGVIPAVDTIIDYDKVDSVFCRLRKDSMEYLRNL